MKADIIATRFWEKANKTETCWLWTASVCGKHGNTRGTFNINGRTRMAHRVAWELANDASIPPGMAVCHTCDRPLCVRPDHLFLGTQRDNIRDMINKGRRATPPTKLYDNAIVEIVAAAAGGEIHVSIARRYGVDRTTVSQILRGLTWQHVTGIPRDG